jgi:beta-glucosidase
VVALLLATAACGAVGGGGGADSAGAADRDAVADAASVADSPAGADGAPARDAEPLAFAFPPGFHFGAATSAHQVEGGQHNNWTQWETLPQFAGRTAAPSGRAVDHYRRYEEDLALAAGMGLDTFRLSVEWSRIEPRPGAWDAAAIAHYRDVVAAAQARGLRASVTLHHFTEPIWLADLADVTEPGYDTLCPSGPSAERRCWWTDPAAPVAFAAFCGQMAAALGDRVDEWMTFNELFGHWLNTAVAGEFPPGLGATTPAAIRADALPVLRALLAAHAACYRAVHAADQTDADGDGVAARVGLTTGTGAVRPADPGRPADVEAARQGESLATFLVFDAAHGGALDADFDTVAEEQHPEWAGTLDVIGLQYYASTVVLGLELLPPLWGVPCLNFADPFLVDLLARAGCPPPPTPDFPLGDEGEARLYGRQHDPEGLRTVLDALHARYPGVPIVITEHGFADDDRKRAASLIRHLAVAATAVADGIPLTGYYHWSLLDNFEWALGFDVRFGLVRVHYDDDLRREPTVAAEVYRAVTAARGIPRSLWERWGGSGAILVAP